MEGEGLHPPACSLFLSASAGDSLSWQLVSTVVNTSVSFSPTALAATPSPKVEVSG